MEKVLIGIFFVILVSLQYTLNKILAELKNIKTILMDIKFDK